MKQFCKLYIYIFVSLLFGIGNYNNSFAQKKPITSYFYTGFAANSYRGDLSKSFKKWNPEVQIGFVSNTKNRINFGLSAGFGYLTGDNRKYIFDENSTPNKYFKTEFYRFWGEGLITFYRNKFLHLYASTGVGFLRFSVFNQYGESLLEDYYSRPKGEVYGTNMIFLPQTLGIMFFLPNGFSFKTNIQYVILGNDYIDNLANWGIVKGKDKFASLNFSFMIPVGR